MNQEKSFELLQTALQGAVEAAQAIMQIYSSDFSTTMKDDGSPVTIADHASNDVLVAHLSKTGIPLISEESLKAPFEERKNWDYVWCIDPLDGTKEFIKKNDEFAICVALVHQQQPILGIIVSPIQKTILVGGKVIPPAIIRFEDIDQPSAWNYIEQKQQINQPLVIAVSRSQGSGTDLKFNQSIKEQFGEVVFLKKGSALKFFDLAMGHADIYARYAPTMEWDIAAGQAIIEALGGKVIHAESGEPLYYNKANLYNPYFIVHTSSVIKHLGE